MWAYKTSIKTATGATPFSLVYGYEVVVPLELELPSLRISLQGEISDEEARKARLHQLESLDEKIIKAIDICLRSCLNHYNRSPNLLFSRL